MINFLLYFLAAIGLLAIITTIIVLIILAIDFHKYKEWEYVEGYGFKKKIPEDNQDNSSQCKT